MKVHPATECPRREQKVPDVDDPSSCPLFYDSEEVEVWGAEGSGKNAVVGTDRGG